MKAVRSSRHILILLALMSMAVWGIIAHAQSDLYVLPPASAPLSIGGTMDITTNGRVLLAANMLNNTVSLVDVPGRSLIVEIPVGSDPRGVSFTPDDNRALVVNRADGTLSVIDITTRSVEATYSVGILPYAVVTTSDRLAYISLQATDEVIEIDYTTGQILRRISTPALPTGLTLWGQDMLYVTHLWTGEISLIHLPQTRVVRVANGDTDMGLSFSVLITRNDGTLYAPQSRSYPSNPALTYDSALTPLLNTFNLRSLDILPNSRLSLDVADRPVNMPFAVAIDTARNWAFVANAGTNDVSIINLNTGLAVTNLHVGTNPRAVILSADNSSLYVHNVLEGSVSIIDTRALRVRDIVPISDLRVPIGRLLGAEYFHSARDTQMGARTLSCASCHFDGLSDGRVWRNIDGERLNTPHLFNLEETAPYTWRGAWDEVADVELKIRALQFGQGLLEGVPNPPLGEPHGGLSLDLDLLAAYLISLEGPPTPTTQSTTQTELIARGSEIFTTLGCATCHMGTAYTDGLLHDVGTDGEFNTPTLNWLWLAAPYLHDGRAATLRDVFVLPGAHQLVAEVAPEDIDALLAFLLSLPADD